MLDSVCCIEHLCGGVLYLNFEVHHGMLRTQDAIVGREGLGWDFPEPQKCHVILVVTCIMGGALYPKI